MDALRIGRHAISKILEIESAFAPAREFFPDLTGEMLNAYRSEVSSAAFDARDFVRLSFHCFVIRTDRHTILVDTCCGNDKDRQRFPAFHRLRSGFLDALAANRLRPEQVDYVLCTHLHWDHVGWNTRSRDGSWVPTFPNARYVISRSEYEYWDAAYASGREGINVTSFADSVLPVKRAGQVVIVDDHHELGEGIGIEPCPGHTPGHAVITLSSEGSKGVFSGDAIHHPIQLRHPSLSMLADVDPELARRSRLALVQELADSATLLLPAHFMSPTVGRIRAAATGFRYEPVG